MRDTVKKYHKQKKGGTRKIHKTTKNRKNQKKKTSCLGLKIKKKCYFGG